MKNIMKSKLGYMNNALGAWVVFSGETDLPWLRLLKRAFVIALC